MSNIKTNLSKIKRLILEARLKNYLKGRLKLIDVSSNRFDFYKFRMDVNNFVSSQCYDNSAYQYTYSSSCNEPSLYASSYACMILSILGYIDDFEKMDKENWKTYFDSFQNKNDGLFYDPVVRNKNFDDSDWWGARHLALHMINAYTCLGQRPQHRFEFLKKYYNSVEEWLSNYRWDEWFDYSIDFDNKIMNIGSLLQYQRDTWNDQKAGSALEELKEFLRLKINPATGMWGDVDLNDIAQVSRHVQFAYHLFPLFFL